MSKRITEEELEDLAEAGAKVIMHPAARPGSDVQVLIKGLAQMRADLVEATAETRAELADAAAAMAAQERRLEQMLKDEFARLRKALPHKLRMVVELDENRDIKAADITVVERS